MTAAPFRTLVFRRTGSPTPVRMACMYCGAPATHRVDRRVTNRPTDSSGGRGPGYDATQRTTADAGDNPVGAVLAVVGLVIFAVQVVGDVRDWLARRRELAPSAKPGYTVVTITTCDRHRRYWPFALRAWLGALGLFLGTVVLAVAFGHGYSPWASLFIVLPMVALFVGPMLALIVLSNYPRVRVTDVSRDTVTLGGISPAYFGAAEKEPTP